MSEIVLAVMLVSAVLYAVLGGADFGAGMIESLLGPRGQKQVDEALAPVWEANHVWMVLLVVLAFVGFPPLYTHVSIFLHIPIVLVLLGIVARGSAFTFRHYDPEPGLLDAWYTWVFRVSSLLTPLFLGVSVAAMVQGTLPTTPGGSFYDCYVGPWNTAFCWTTGVFVCALFAFEGAALLSAEHARDSGPLPWLRLARGLHLLAIVTGAAVLFAAWRADLAILHAAVDSPASVTAFAVATAITPVVAYAFRHGMPWTLRVATGAQVFCVLTGLFAARYPALLVHRAGVLTIADAAAPASTLRTLVIALIIGLVLIIPSLVYLLRVYKRADSPDL
ncbi:MAG: cytochrome d ubiquinol oxidase subunit II [Polyangiales bacterium]